MQTDFKTPPTFFCYVELQFAPNCECNHLPFRGADVLDGQLGKMRDLDKMETTSLSLDQLDDIRH